MSNLNNPVVLQKLISHLEKADLPYNSVINMLKQKLGGAEGAVQVTKVDLATPPPHKPKVETFAPIKAPGKTSVPPTPVVGVTDTPPAPRARDFWSFRHDHIKSG